MSCDTQYLRPAGLIWGVAARAAAASGQAGLLCGGDIGFTSVEVISRSPGGISREWCSFGDLAASSDAGIGNKLQVLTTARKRICGLDLTLPRIIGIVNVTPDSFSDGGQTPDADSAVAHGRALISEGADILDVGGESTRPGSDAISAAEEARRVLPVIEELSTGADPVSIDTRKAEVMRKAAEAGAQILNDVSALTFDADSMETARELSLPVILMHSKGDPKTMQQNPVYEDVALEVFDTLAGQIAECVRNGIGQDMLIADPGIGFGKTFAHNLELLNGLTLFHGLGVPIMVGASRKAFIGALTGEKVAAKRTYGSVAVAISAAMQAAQFLRVHDVGETIQALRVWQAASGLPKCGDCD